MNRLKIFGICFVFCALLFLGLLISMILIPMICIALPIFGLISPNSVIFVYDKNEEIEF